MPDPQDSPVPALKSPSDIPQLTPRDQPALANPDPSVSSPQPPPPPPPKPPGGPPAGSQPFSQTPATVQGGVRERQMGFPPGSPREEKPADEPRLAEETKPQPPPAAPWVPSPPPPPPKPPGGPPPTESPEVTPPKRGQKLKRALLLLVGIVGIGTLAFFLVRVLLPRIRSLSVPGLPGKAVELTYWGLWEPAPVMQELIDAYSLENPRVTIQYVQQSHKDYRERLQSALARGEGPDIFRYHNTWVPMLVNELDAVPAEAYSAGEFQETFYPVAARDLRRGASFVGIPLEIDGLALFYNKQILRSAGKTPPTTWEDLRKTAFDLTIRDAGGRIQRAGVALGTTGNVDHWPDILALMMLQNGANLADPTDKLAADALLFYSIFTRSDKVWDSTLPSSTQAFAGGELAMYFGPSWRVLDIKALNPDLEFEVMPVPQLPKSNISWASYWVEGVSAASENKQAAWQFLKFLSSRESLEKLYAAAVASGRVIGEPYSRTDMAELLKDDPLAGAYVSQAPNAQSWYASGLTHDNGINDRNIKYFEDAVNAVNQRGDPETALKTAAQGISQVLSQYGVK